MLTNKVDYAKFLIWFIEGYPDSMNQFKNVDKEFWERFKDHGLRNEEEWGCMFFVMCLLLANNIFCVIL